MRKNIQINRRKYPYRGLQTAVGKVFGISSQAVGYALDRNSPEVLKVYNEMLSERISRITHYRQNRKKASRIVV